MQIRENVRRRRRERIGQLLGQRPAGSVGEEPAAAEGQDPLFPQGEPLRSVPSSNIRPAEIPMSPDPVLSGDFRGDSGRKAAEADTNPELYAGDLQEPETDPEKWWKEQQKRLHQAGPAWRGVGALAPTSAPPKAGGGSGGRSSLSRFASGFAARLTAAAVLYGAAWSWFHYDLPGSAQARAWTEQAVTQDMDFQAVEAWYSQTFGGSPSFLPAFRSKGGTQAVFGGWKRNDAVLPVEGRLVQTFAQEGTGVRIAAGGNSAVKAVYAGRVLQVASEDDGKSTVLIQHAGQIVTVYGNLKRPSVRAGDWVEAGQELGRVPEPLDRGGESLLYFAVKQNGKTVDPAEVVPFD